jgi:hypothetical protein
MFVTFVRVYQITCCHILEDSILPHFENFKFHAERDFFKKNYGVRIFIVVFSFVPASRINMSLQKYKRWPLADGTVFSSP